MRIAFKEWAVIVDALGQGQQIIILRKGGISEGRGGFQVDHPAFLLFPTLYHQQRESVLPAAQARYDQWTGSLPGPDQVRLEYHAEVAAWKKIESLEIARNLRGQHVWKDEVIEQRFDWGKGKGIFALVLRVHKLADPVTLPLLESYGGCKSWIELDVEIPTETSRPVLADEVFRKKVAQFETALVDGEPSQ